MRVHRVNPWVFFTPAAMLFAASLAAEDRTAPTLNLRLMTAVSSRTSKPGMPVDAVVIAPYRNGDRVIPPGTLVRGKVRFVKKVGLGLVRETAKMAV